VGDALLSVDRRNDYRGSELSRDKARLERDQISQEPHAATAVAIALESLGSNGAFEGLVDGTTASTEAQQAHEKTAAQDVNRARQYRLILLIQLAL